MSVIGILQQKTNWVKCLLFCLGGVSIHQTGSNVCIIHLFGLKKCLDVLDRRISFFLTMSVSLFTTLS